MATTKYLYNLTPLRGIAALLTVIFHGELYLNFIGGSMLIDQSKSFFINGLYIMVDFFFVLSGFILCYVYRDYFIKGFDKQNFRKFFIARLARIYPIHVFSLFFTAGIWALAGGLGFPKFQLIQVANSAYSFVTNLLLLHSINLHNWFTYTHASWSISTEWWMYMLFPFIVLPILKVPKKAWLVVVTACIGLYLLIEYVLGPSVVVPKELASQFDGSMEPTLNVSYQYGFVRCLAGFVLGMITYMAYNVKWAKNFLSSGWVFLVEISALVICLHFKVNDIFKVLIFPFIILTAAYGNASFNFILESKPLQKIGDWSYSIYLLHQPFLNLFTLVILATFPPKPGELSVQWSQPEAWMCMTVFILFVLWVSSLSYRFIEVPTRNWMNTKWGRRNVAAVNPSPV